MRCPKCGNKTHVFDSRTDKDTNITRRQRECLHCYHRFVTYEFPDTRMIRRCEQHEEKV